MAKYASDFPAASALSSADLLQLVQSGADRRATLAQLLAFIGADRRTVTTATVAAGAFTLNCSLGDNFTVLMTANAALSVSNLAGVGKATEFELQITQDGTGGRTLTLPASFRALGGSDVTIAPGPNAVTVLSAKTFDNGTTWQYAMQESA